MSHTLSQLTDKLFSHLQKEDDYTMKTAQAISNDYWFWLLFSLFKNDPLVTLIKIFQASVKAPFSTFTVHT